MDTNKHYIAIIMEVFSDSADPAQFLLSVCRQILITGFVWFLSPICWHRMSTSFVRFL